MSSSISSIFGIEVSKCVDCAGIVFWSIESSSNEVSKYAVDIRFGSS